MDTKYENKGSYKSKLKTYGLNPAEWRVLDSLQPKAGRMIFQNINDHSFQLISHIHEDQKLIKSLKILSI